MRERVLVLALVAALPVAGQEKQEKKGSAPKPPSLEELVRQADEKTRAGDLEGAADLLRKAVALPGATGDTSLRLGRVLETRNDLDNAMDAYKVAADKSSGAGKGEALGRLAVLQELRGIPEAAASADAAFAADAGGAWPMIARARALARQSKGDEALALAQKAGEAGGASAQASAGAAQEARGDLAAAETAYRAALSAEPNNLWGGIGLARVLRKTGRAAEAEPLVQKVLAAAPGAVAAYVESARIKLALGRAEDATADASTAAALAESDPEAQGLAEQVAVARALVSVSRGQADQAIQDLTALRDQKPASAEVRVGLARALIAKRQAEAAATELAKAIELKPGLAEAHYQLGYVAYALKGDAASAVPELEKAVAAEPANTDYRTYLGAALADPKVGQNDRAVAELTKVTQAPGYAKPDAFIYMGRAQLAAKRYKDAIPPLEKATSLNPQSADAYASLAWCYFGLKDAASFKAAGAKARNLGYKEPTLLQYLTRVEGGEPIK
jgi:tetratricopeptide (TPR) repeat protein